MTIAKRMLLTVFAVLLIVSALQIAGVWAQTDEYSPADPDWNRPYPLSERGMPAMLGRYGDAELGTEAEHLGLLGRASQFFKHWPSLNKARDEDISRLVEILIPTLGELLDHPDHSVRFNCAALLSNIPNRLRGETAYPLDSLAPQIISRIDEEREWVIRGMLLRSLYGFADMDEETVAYFFSEIRSETTIAGEAIAMLSSIAERNDDARRALLQLIDEREDIAMVISYVDRPLGIETSVLDKIVSRILNDDASNDEWERFLFILQSKTHIVDEYPTLRPEIARVIRDTEATEFARVLAMSLVVDVESLQDDDTIASLRNIAEGRLAATPDNVLLAKRVLDLVEPKPVIYH